MATGEPNLYANFSGGVNLQSAPYLLDETQAQDARNVHSTQIGSIRKREGLVTLTEDTSSPKLDGAIHSLFPVNLSTKTLLAVGKQASASNDRIVAVETNGTITTLSSSMSQGKRWAFAQGPASGTQGPIYGINGTNDPWEWDGVLANAPGTWTAVEADGTTPISPHPAKPCTMLIYHLDKFWASGDPSYPGRIYSTGFNPTTNLPDPRIWDSDYIDHVDPNDGEAITGLGKVGPYLLVFKAHKTYALSDPAGRAYRPIHSSIGCIAHRSIVETSIGAFFLSEDLGVCLTDGSDVTPVSDNILPLIREAADANAANFTKAAGAYFRDSYWLSIPTESSEPDLLLEFQLKTKSWWIHSPGISQFALLDPSGTPKLYASDAQAKRISQAFVEDVFTDDDAEYAECYWQGPFWPWGQPHLNKRVSQFRADGLGNWDTYASTAFNADYELLDEIIWEDQSTGETFGGSGTFGGVSDEFMPPAGVTQRRYYTPTQGWGRSWSLKLVFDDPNESEVFSIAGFVRGRAD